jgi:hypothetical protein
MRDTFAAHDLDKGQQDNFQIKEKRAMVEIIFVKINFDWDGAFIPANY